MNVKDKIEYILIVIGEFARLHGLSMKDAYRYIKTYHGMEIIDDGYDIEHTYDFVPWFKYRLSVYQFEKIKGSQGFWAGLLCVG